MKSRKDLSDILHLLAPNVYYQPPTGTKIKYPCIIYERSSVLSTFADNRKYLNTMSYTITVIDKDPDSDIPNKVNDTFTMCEWQRHYVSDNLNHDVFFIYF